jgi:RHH-type rel operon transcriptional repressor/antitoxin RelB
MDPLLEKQLDQAAKRRGVTKSQFVIDAVERALGHKDPLQILHEVSEEMLPYVRSRVGVEPAGASPVLSKLQAEHAAQQSDYKAYLRAQTQARKKDK